MSREPRGAEECGRTVLAREDLLLLLLALPAAILFPLRVEHIWSESSSQRSRQQLVPHRVPQTVLVSDFNRREARATQVTQEHLALPAAGLARLAVR